MNGAILFISDDVGSHPFRTALTKNAPECRLEFAGNRDEVRSFRAPALIVLDLMLSREHPFEMLRWLRNEAEYKDVPIFVLGSEIIDHEIDEAYALGANACLLKRPAPEGFEGVAQGLATYASLLPSPGLACSL